ncbi:MAG TPA: hypothetical protein VFS97_09060 [Nitrososphaeraceae archaeon]|jgi:hypothetical protein|nr:hypothetical protein [Nitrososphaeraceae archaeon]
MYFLLIIAFGLILIFAIWLNNDIAYAETLSPPAVKITSPESNNQQIPIGELVVLGTSSDNIDSDCTVYIDWNDLKPYQKVEATGAGGNEDYSNWTFTYTESYHLISQGTNELTSKITCYSNPVNLTKHYSINVTGIKPSIETPPEPEIDAIDQKEEENNGDISSLLPFVSAADHNQENTDENTDNDSSDDGNDEDNDSGDDLDLGESNDDDDSFFDGDSFFDD